MRLQGKVAIITGGARGQGEAAARRFVAEGATVVIGDVLDGSALAAEIGATYIKLDVSSEDDWEAAAAAAPGLNVVVNNAGIVRFAGIGEMSAEAYMDVIRVNQLGTFLGLRTAARHMKDGGAVVNVASTASKTGMSGLVAYSASKGAVVSMTRVAAVELARLGIRVNTVIPGGVDTPMGRPEGVPEEAMQKIFKRIPARRIGRPDEIAAVVAFLASDEASYVTGAEIAADGGALATDILG